MPSQTERILVINHDLPVGAAIVRRLIRLGHPRSQIFTARGPEADLTRWACAQSFIQRTRPDQIYVGATVPTKWKESSQHGPTDLKTESTALSPLVEAAALSGVRQFMYVATAEATRDCVTAIGHCDIDYSKEEGLPMRAARGYGSTDDVALYRQALMDAFDDRNDFDFRFVLTSEPYGPSWSPSGAWLTKRAGSADTLIVAMFETFCAAKESATEKVTISIDSSQRFDLIFVDDVADASVALMELPQRTFRSKLNRGSRHINLESGLEVKAQDLVRAVATAAGYRGHVSIDSTCSPRSNTQITRQRSNEFGWKPLVNLQTGLELTAMAFQIFRFAKRRVDLSQHRDVT